MTPAEIAALVASIRARADAATPGPWDYYDEDGDVVAPFRDTEIGILSTQAHADGKFVAYARDDVPILLDLIDTLTADLAKAEARRDLAEQTIADAPHGSNCDSHVIRYDLKRGTGRCTCWKAKYEAAKEAMK